MRALWLALLFLFNFSVFSQSVNLDFENQDFSGWAGSYTDNNCTTITPNSANTFTTDLSIFNSDTDQTAICTSGYDPNVLTGQLPRVNPYEGSSSCRLGDGLYYGCGSAYLSQTFQVTTSNSLLIFYYAIVLRSGHVWQDMAKFGFRILDANNNPIYTLNNSFTSSLFQPADPLDIDLYYIPWQRDSIILTNLVGQNVTIDLYTSDCNESLHRCYAYLDFGYGDQSSAIPFFTKEDPVISPNPCNEYFKISGKTGEIKIYDIMGNTVLTSSSISTVNTSQLAEGVYFVQVIPEGTAPIVQKLLVKH